MASVPWLSLSGGDAESKRGSFAAEVARRLGRPAPVEEPARPTTIKLSTPPIKIEPDWPPTPSSSVKDPSPARQSPPKAARPDRWHAWDFARLVDFNVEIDHHWNWRFLKRCIDYCNRADPNGGYEGPVWLDGGAEHPDTLGVPLDRAPANSTRMPTLRPQEADYEPGFEEWAEVLALRFLYNDTSLTFGHLLDAKAQSPALECLVEALGRVVVLRRTVLGAAAAGFDGPDSQGVFARLAVRLRASGVSGERFELAKLLAADRGARIATISPLVEPAPAIAQPPPSSFQPPRGPRGSQSSGSGAYAGSRERGDDGRSARDDRWGSGPSGGRPAFRPAHDGPLVKRPRLYDFVQRNTPVAFEFDYRCFSKVLDHVRYLAPAWHLDIPSWLDRNSPDNPKRNDMPIHREPLPPEHLPTLSTDKADLTGLIRKSTESFELMALQWMYRSGHLGVNHLRQAKDISAAFAELIEAWGKLFAVRILVIGGGPDTERWIIFDRLADRLVLGGRAESSPEVRQVRQWAGDRDLRLRQFGIYGISYPPPSAWPPVPKRKPDAAAADAGSSKRPRVA